MEIKNYFQESSEDKFSDSSSNDQNDRKSKVIMKMSIEEINAAEQKNELVEVTCIVNVFDQKSTKSRVPVPVVFANEEFQALNIYIQELWDKVGTHKNSFRRNLLDVQNVRVFSEYDLDND